MLTAFSVASLRRDFDLLRRQRCIRLLAQRQHRDCNNRCMPPTFGFGRRNALDDVFA
jgi:hypothetical protein